MLAKACPTAASGTFGAPGLLTGGKTRGSRMADMRMDERLLRLAPDRVQDVAAPSHRLSGTPHPATLSSLLDRPPARRAISPIHPAPLTSQFGLSVSSFLFREARLASLFDATWPPASPGPGGVASLVIVSASQQELPFPAYVTVTGTAPPRTTIMQCWAPGPGNVAWRSHSN